MQGRHAPIRFGFLHAVNLNIITAYISATAATSFSQINLQDEAPSMREDLVKWQFGPIMFLQDTNRLAQPEPPLLRVSFLMSHFNQANAALLIA